VSTLPQRGTVTRRRFIGTAAAAGAVVALRPASAPALTPTSPPGLYPNNDPTSTEEYLKQQRTTALLRGGNLAFMTGVQLAVLLLNRDISSRELTQAFLTRIAALNGDGGFSVGSRPITGTTPNPDIPVYGNNGKLNCFVCSRSAARS
jgi:hypothetical protein